MATYFDVKLKELDLTNLTGNVLILGNEDKKEEIIIKLVDYFLKKYPLKSTVISENKKFMTQRDTKYFNKYSQVLTNTCFASGNFLFIDAYEYTHFNMELIQNHINNNHLNIIHDDANVNIFSFLEMNIEFDYIILLDTGYIKQDYTVHQRVKFPNLLQDVLREDKIEQKNNDGSITHIVSFDIIELIDTIDVANTMNEKIYLVLDVKNKKLLHFTQL